MGQEQGQAGGQKGVKQGVKKPSLSRVAGSKRTSKPAVDSPGELRLRLSSLACFPPLMENVDPGDEPEDAGVAEHTAEALRSLVGALQHVQALTSKGSGTAAAGFSDATTLIQGAIALLAKREEPAAERRSPLDPKQFRSLAQLVRKRRKAALLNRVELAKLAGISPSTVKGIEAMRNNPGRATLCRLLAVPELGLEVSALTPDVQTDPAWQPNSCMLPRYDPVRLAEEMLELVNGPGGTFEQTYLYLDPQSAADFLKLSSSDGYAANFRDSCPLEEVAARAAKLLGARRDIDVNALGPGDGRQEVRLVRHLLDALPRSEMRLFLLDISHFLLSIARQHAVTSLPNQRVSAFALHGNFHDLARYPVLHGSSGGTRLYTMLGYTITNLDNEVRFFRELAACAAAGDLLALDFSAAHGPPDQPARLALRDPVLLNGPAASHADWLSGPILRHCRGASSVKLTAELNVHCPVPGSYELGIFASVAMADKTERRFLMCRIRRYDAERLTECLRGLGWELVFSKSYGPAGVKAAAVMLLRRMG